MSKSMIKVPDAMLQRLQCLCGAYLSSPPISIKQNGQSRCSTCTKNHLGTSPPLRNIAYETLASLLAFPCRFKPQGCTEYIDFSKMTHHQAKCYYRDRSCPISLHSKCTWLGTLSNLQQHYKDQHPELLLTSPNIKVDIQDFELYYMLQVGTVPLLLQIKCSLTEAKLWFNLVSLRLDVDADLITFTVGLRAGSISRAPCLMLEKTTAVSADHMQMNPEECLHISISTIMDFLKHPKCLQCVWFVNLSRVVVGKEPSVRVAKGKD